MPSSFRHADRELDRSRTEVSAATLHPNGSRAHINWAEDQTLHVAVMYSNPYRWRTRLRLFNDALRHLRTLPNIKLYVGELAYGDRPFEVTSLANPLDFQWRTRDILWHKENILNLVIKRFAPGWEYGAYVDGDFTFTRHDVCLETVHMLQIYDWVQMYSTYMDLTHDHQPLTLSRSFTSRFMAGEITDAEIRGLDGPGYYYPAGLLIRGLGATGGAMAFRRESFEACGGLLDTCILGSGDWHMAFGLVGVPDWHPEIAGCSVQYANAIKTWQTRAARSVQRNVGCVDCHAIHHWHGSKRRRGYGTRWKIIHENLFDPYADIHQDSNGVYQLTDQKTKLRDEIRKYFVSRGEDSIELYEGDTPMV